MANLSSIPITPSAKAARQSVNQVASDFNTHLSTGLRFADVTLLRSIYGWNELEKGKEESLTAKFLKSFSENPLILLLLGSAVVSLLMGQMDDAVSITMAIVIVVTVAFVQEYKSEKSLEALNKLVPHYCRLIRDGQYATVLANDLVPGDLVQFGIGDRIPADCRLVSAVDLEIDESNLTGENKPRRKNVDPIQSNGELGLSERDNIAYMGTLVRNGHGTGLVVATGKATEFGHVFELMQEVEVRKTPLQISMNELGKQLSIFSFGVIGLIVLIGLLQKRSWLEMFTIGVSLAVAAIPEGLPIVVTVTLALGVIRMANRQAIVKQLPSVETLGSVNVVCADKTGTLTVNQMTVTNVFTLDNEAIFDFEHSAPTQYSEALRQTLRIGNLCNNAQRTEDGKFIGQPTDMALLDVLQRSGLRDERPDFHRVAEQPFNSDLKYMTVVCRDEHQQQQMYQYTKGATEILLDRCSTYLIAGGQQRPLTAAQKEEVQRHASAMSSHGLRVLAMAYAPCPDGTINNTQPLCFTGFVSVYDPPRATVAPAIQELVQGGVKVVMITGDSEATACSIARRLGIPLNTKGGCLTGKEIELMSERQLQEMINSVSVFARTTPKHKLAIVRAFQTNGSVVAMTGDGVNDAPALKMADIGISMGKSGTDVSKEAADMILVDDDFSTILHAIEEGKSIFYNIQNFLTFQLSTSISALSLIALSTLFGLATPLNAMQILWINIIMDGPPAQSLGVEPVDPDVMKKPPRARTAKIITKRLISRVITAACIVVIGTLSIYMSELQEDGANRRGTTMTFTTFVFFDMFNALACRSEKQSIFKLGLFSNRMFNLAVGGSILSQLLVIYLPFFQNIFQTEPLSLYDLFKIVLLTSSVFIVDEVKKYMSAQGITVVRQSKSASSFKFHLERHDQADAAMNQV
ncbi:PMR1-type calcium-transporting P-type ATPase [Hesseltinella vesiculosa]|uniref:Calcium-transporting ATPase n=1 Tax=Hesseltinella vesiculosa TaxID=101127 RepID=A0A1X2GHY9_9FUNG|nr:PMR1-type calcium-transporting P-type ATPase [Hesseltinella vesiculosa]